MDGKLLLKSLLRENDETSTNIAILTGKELSSQQLFM